MRSVTRTRSLTSASLLLAAAACSAPEAPPSIILLIADGAGTAHWTLASYANQGLAVDAMKTMGLVDTRGADHTVSGSAPTATAYATGVRSFMGAISVGPDSLANESVLEVALARGMSAGLITTTSLADATPAAFGAHVSSRTEMGEIARQMTSKGIAVLLGGGRSVFPPEVRQGYTYVEEIDALRDLDVDTVESLLGLFAEGDMGIVADRGSALQDMTGAALRILDRNPDGFFLMVENEESDTQAHRNVDPEIVTAEMLDFDRAVGLALAYQAAHPRTLVIVTGDHETGGISLPHDADREIVPQYATGRHTGAMVPLFASGPGAERFAGIIENRRVGEILLEMLRAGAR
jgi:alkaline phosphatase